VTAATGFKRVGILAAAVIATGLAALVVASFVISADSARDAVKAQIRTVTGLDPVLRGPVTLSMFPSGLVTFSDVVLGEENGQTPPLAAEHLIAHLRFLPLLLGRIEISDIALEQPRIAVEIAPDGHSNWSPLLESLGRALKPFDRTVSFSEIRIHDGTIAVRDAGRDLTERLSNVELSLAWPSITKSFGATGRFVWRDEPVDASISISDFLAALAGDSSGLKVRLSGTPLRLVFEGVMSNRPSFKVDGTLAAETSSLRDALRWTGDTPLPGGGFGRFTLKAQANMVGGAMSLSGVNLELDGNAAEGVLNYTANGHTAWQGTLAADELDLTPYVSTVRLMSTARDWDRMPIALEGLTGFEIDLRLSAAKVTIGNAKLGRTAVAASLRGGKLVVTVGESQAYNGLIKGSVSLAKSEVGAELKSQMQFTDVDLESCLGDLIGIRRLEGKGNVSFALEGTGASVLGLARTVSGTATITGRQGALSGLNVEQLLRRLERRPLSGGADFRSGRTPFDKLAITLKASQGAVTVDEMTIDGAAVRIGLTGTASVPTRDLDLKGTASLLNGPNDVAFELPFVVQGPWDNPLPIPDPTSLIRRSGAAAPLLDALRDKKTRDAVRSAIEKLGGARPSADAAVPPATPPRPAEPR
jgi:AsmA protein